MAVDAPVLYNGWWVYLRDSMGSTHLNPNEKQILNAYKMRTALQQQGYCAKAIAGVIGNAQVESSLTTGAIQKWSALPNNGEILSECTNAYMLQHYSGMTAGGQGYGLGLLQWDRFSSTYRTNDLLGWTNANGFLWYDGDGQMARLAFEYDHNAQYGFWRLNYGSEITWDVYKNIETSQFSSYSPGECANVWRACWEVGGDDSQQARRDNAEFWYQYFIDHPNPPHTGRFPAWLLYKWNKTNKINQRGGIS